MGSFVGGAALGVVAAISLVFGTLGFKWLTNPLVYIGNIYRLIFGVVICVLDGPTDSHPNMQRTILTYASFMQNNFSRSAFYLFIACMEHPEGVVAYGRGLLLLIHWRGPLFRPSHRGRHQFFNAPSQPIKERRRC